MSLSAKPNDIEIEIVEFFNPAFLNKNSATDATDATDAESHDMMKNVIHFEK